ncbi:MAG: hypothetical protein M5U28_40190 [Sandaracinaceae bacterium]|nr:hypothetical protein [Sandaracinaceae bacterium]
MHEPMAQRSSSTTTSMVRSGSRSSAVRSASPTHGHSASYIAICSVEPAQATSSNSCPSTSRASGENAGSLAAGATHVAGSSGQLHGGGPESGGPESGAGGASVPASSGVAASRPASAAAPASRPASPLPTMRPEHATESASTDRQTQALHVMAP